MKLRRPPGLKLRLLKGTEGCQSRGAHAKLSCQKMLLAITTQRHLSKQLDHQMAMPTGEIAPSDPGSILNELGRGAQQKLTSLGSRFGERFLSPLGAIRRESRNDAEAQRNQSPGATAAVLLERPHRTADRCLHPRSQQPRNNASKTLTKPISSREESPPESCQ